MRQKDKTLMSPVVKSGNEMKEPGKEVVKKTVRRKFKTSHITASLQLHYGGLIQFMIVF